MKIWAHFMVFASMILLLMALFQIVFLQSYYQYTKTQSIRSAAAKIAKEYDGDSEYFTTLDALSAANEMDITILTLDGQQLIYDSGETNLVELIAKVSVLQQFRDKVLQSPDGYYYRKLVDQSRGTQALLFGTFISTKKYDLVMVYLYTALEPVGATVNILTTQYYIITVMVLVLAFFIAFFISRQIVRPITRLTRSAKQLAQGDYSSVFEYGSYTEVNQLADTLNYATREIRKADELKRDLIANTSHDLRTPLTMIKAYAEMIRDLSGNNPQKRAEHLNVIISESDRLAELVSDMLALSKLQAGTMSINIAPCNVSELLDSMTERYDTLGQRQGFKLETSLERGVIVLADDARLSQAIGNLVNNAINYTGDDRRVMLRLLRKTGVGGPSARIEVSDTGPGIAPEEVPYIWERYYKAKSANRGSAEGTGLGLYIVKGILDSHGFRYGVDSVVGQGSTFWIEAPLAVVGRLPS